MCWPLTYLFAYNAASAFLCGMSTGPVLLPPQNGIAEVRGDKPSGGRHLQGAVRCHEGNGMHSCDGERLG